MTEYPHLLPACRQYAEMGTEERVAWIRADRWLETVDAGAALARLEDLLSYPPRDRMPCLLLYGDTGMGKTKIIRKFLRDHQPNFRSWNRGDEHAGRGNANAGRTGRTRCLRRTPQCNECTGSKRRRDLPTEDHLPDPDAQDGGSDADH